MTEKFTPSGQSQEIISTKYVPVKIFSTGGTIDSSPDYVPTEKSVFQGTYLPQMFANARFPQEAVVVPLMQKDSMDLTVEDRELMYKSCMESVEDRILFTHGTDTIAETARFLGEKGVGNKTVVLVGSFVPLSQPNSDATFNLGYAVAAAQLLPPGVWVAINGEIFSWDNVEKDREQMRFKRPR